MIGINRMELKELTEKAVELFGVNSPHDLGKALLSACSDTDKLDSFCKLVDGDLSVDWLQKIYQYYLADRDQKKQDYTPSSIAQFMGLLAGESDHVIDLCAGSGALIIQKWAINHDVKVTAIEYDEAVIPFLLFNLVIRNIQADVFHKDALTDDGPINSWIITKGETYGNLIDI